MSTFSFLNVCLMLLFVLRRHTVCSTNAITCDAGTYVVGEPASVSCNLHEDMKECKLSFIIERFQPNNVTNVPGKEVVACRWEETTHNHTCNVENGYRLNDDKGDQPTLVIPSLDNNSVGFYMCYVMPPEGTKTHVCKLTSIARPVTQPTLSTATSFTTTPTAGRCETSSTSPVLIAVVVLALLIILSAIGYIVYRRLIKGYVCRNGQQQKEGVEPASLQPLVSSKDDNVECTVQKTHELADKRVSLHTSSEIEVYLKDFKLDARDYERVMSLLDREMKDKHTKMPSTVVRSVSNERETGHCLVVILGNTMLKIALFKLQGENVDASQAESFKITSKIRQGKGEQFLTFITNSINEFVDTHNLSGRRMPLGFVVSFPCEHAQDNGHHLTKVGLTKWTNGFGCKDLVGRNMDDILQEALRNTVKCELEIKAIINNAEDMLVSAAHQDANSKIALVLGDGFNACYVQQENKVYTTTECGSFGDGGCLDLYRTDFDSDLDNNSINSREQIMEKMVSMAYLGELVRLVLVKLTKEKLLFKSVARESALYKADSFKTSFMPLVERDTDGKFQSTECVLGMLEVDSYTAEDCETVQYVCRLISERAAHLAATVVAALVKHVQQPEITIAIEESLYRSHSQFYQLMIEKTLELVGEESKINIKPFPNKSGRGVALLATVVS